jgi:hypothetical protein
MIFVCGVKVGVFGFRVLSSLLGEAQKDFTKGSSGNFQRWKSEINPFQPCNSEIRK